MKRLLLLGLLGMSLLPCASLAADPSYVNLGTVNTPQVDAVIFVNKGLFQASTMMPYETWNTLHYTNAVGTYSGSGTMSGRPGFRFSTTSSLTGNRTMASSFYNDNGAVVIANDGSSFYVPCALASVGPSHLIVQATNIVVKGGTSGLPKASLIVGANGEMELTGKNVGLTNSGLEVLPVWAETVGSRTGETNFSPDIAISDLYWGRTNFTKDYFPLFSGSLWNGFAASAQGGPWPEVQPGGDPGFTIVNPWADSYINVLPDGIATVTITNSDGSTEPYSFPTNVVKGAIFADAGPGMFVELGFYGPNLVGFNAAAVLFGVQVTNVVTAKMENAYLYLDDRLAYGGLGTTGILTSVIGCPPWSTSRPANYYLDRGNWYPGDPGNNGYPLPDFFVAAETADPSRVVSDGVTNTVLESGEFASYGAFSDNVVSRPLPVAGGTVTNLPGRIRISSSNLDMSRSRMRAEGEIIIQSTHLISSTNAVLDCEHLSLNLASTNGSLRIQNLSKDTVDRFRGTIRVWSAVWSNTAVVLLENYSVDTNGVATLLPITNTVSIAYHTLMVDATALGVWQLPVTVHEFVSTQTTNVVIGDNVSVGESLLIDGKSLTLDGNLTISGRVPIVNPIIGAAPPGNPLQDWTGTNAPNLLYFTNHGAFSIHNDAHFGDDRAKAYSSFINTGTINAWSLQAKSDYLQNNGSLSSLGILFLQCSSGKFENGSSSSGGDSQFLSGSLKFNNYQMTVNGGLYLRATNALFDAGGGSGNVLTVQNGFNLQAKPATGDLLGTTIETAAPAVPSVAIEHTWAGEDRGPHAAGFTNNTALGKLVVSSKSTDPFFYFAGTGNQNGLYVDQLDLTNLGTNYQSRIAIDPNLTIYFASAKLGFTPPNIGGIQQQPEEYLDGKFDGHLRWVSDFSGPNSSTAVISNGVSILVNSALRFSKLIDSNTNGVSNFYDPYPFSTSVVLTASLIGANQPAPLAVAISWTAAPKTVYQVEYSSGPALNNWQPLLRYTNSTATSKVVSVSDTNAPLGVTRRFYRVGYSQ